MINGRAQDAFTVAAEIDSRRHASVKHLIRR